MENMTCVLGLLFIASLISSFGAEVSVEKRVRKSSLILEYNWPEPSKSLERIPHSRSCHHFIHTKRDGRHVVKRCHGDKIFDYRSLRCQNKSSAKCWIDIVKKGNIKKMKRPFSCPFPWGLYPDRENCSLFYDCMGGKVFPRKCPDSTLFDVVEKICVHSKKALCAEESDDRIAWHSQLLINQRANKEKNSWASRNSVTTTISSQSSDGTFDIHSKEKSSDDDSSEEAVKRHHTKSKNNFFTSKLSLKSNGSINSKSYKTPAIDSKDDSSEENNSSEEKVRTKSKTKFITSKLSLLSTSTVNPKWYRTTDSNSEENSSEEESSSEEKAHTKSKNKFTTSKLSFLSTSTANLNSYRTPDDKPEEENSSEKKDSKMSSRHVLKFTTFKIQASSDNNYNKRISKEFIPATTIVFTEKQRITPSSQSDHSSELLLQSSTINTLISTENKEDKNTMIPEVSEKDGDRNDDTKNVPRSTEIISSKTTSSAQPFSHKIVDSTTKPPLVLDLSTIHIETTENTEIETKGIFNSLCPGFDGTFPHPKDKHSFVVCVEGHPTVMKCPANLVYDTQIESCNYEKDDSVHY